MKLHALAAAALLAAPALATAQVTGLTLVATINVGGVAIAPQDVAFYNDTIVGTGFSNQVVFQISDPTGTPVVTQLTDLSSATTWGASRGPQDIDVVGSIAYVVGDNGTAGNIFEIDLTDGSLDNTIVTTRGSAILYSSPTAFFFGEAASSTLEVVDGTGASVSSSALPDVGYRSPIRDIVLVGTDLFYVSGATNGTDPHTLGRFSPITGATFAGSTWSAFFDTVGFGSRNNLGLATFNDGTTDWLVFSETDQGTANSVLFVDASNSSNFARYGGTDLGSALQVTGLNVGQIGGTDYVAVTSQNGGTNANEVYLFEINNSASVNDWTIMN